MSSKTAKAMVAVAGFIAIVVVEVADAIVEFGGDGSFSADDWTQIVVAGATAVGVWLKRNKGYIDTGEEPPPPPTQPDINNGDAATRPGDDVV